MIKIQNLSSIIFVLHESLYSQVRESHLMVIYVYLLSRQMVYFR